MPPAARGPSRGRRPPRRRCRRPRPPGARLAKRSAPPKVRRSVRAGADAEVVPAPPVGEVVARARGPAPGVVGNLIGLEPGSLQHGHRGLEEIGGEIGPRDPKRPATHRSVKGGPRLDGELVGRDVLGPEVHGLSQLGGPGGRRLAGQGVDQVEGEPGKGGAGAGGGAAAGGGVVVAAEEISGRCRRETGGPARGDPLPRGRGPRSGPPRRRWDWPPG